MNTNRIKKLVSCVAFCALFCCLLARTNDILVSKQYNRYYMMEKIAQEAKGSYDVHVYGACHSYTSFHPIVLEANCGITSYVIGNPGEIIPVTYLRMMEGFRRDVPEVAVVEIWGLNAYETYSSVDRIFSYYMPVNIERLPLSLEKMEVIQDYASLDLRQENFAVAKYKERIMNGELTKLDFSYSIEDNIEQTSQYSKEEMTMRAQNNGFTVMPMWWDDPQGYTPYMDVSDYDERQAKVAEDDCLPYESDIVKYVDKIIALCEKYEVELIFYRAPYISRENELRKANWFSQYCQERGIVYIDLEKEMEFNLDSDFLDYWHLNEEGAKKATNYLATYILDAMK